MSRRPGRYTQAEIVRALNAAKQAGVVMAVEIAPDGTIRLVPAEPISLKAVVQPSKIVL